MVLAKIIARKRADVARRKLARPLATFIEALAPSERSFETALRAKHCGFILECKRASPSAGVLRADYDPVAIARSYVDVADAISVVCDEPFFGGSLDHLALVRGAVAQPVLCKDFVVDTYQVYEARLFGADAILLMASVLDASELRQAMAAAERLAMATLVEVHDLEELSRALALGARVIGINNRNLHTLDVSVAVTEALAPKVPTEVVLVSESGISSHRDVVRLRAHANAFLVGTALMREAHLAHAARALSYGRVKICGLTRSEDAGAAWRAGAVWGGLNFAPESPRRVTFTQAELIRAAAPLWWAGVFVNEPHASICEQVARLSLDAVQLHGEESPESVRSLRQLLPAHCEIWKAWRVRAGIPRAADLGAERMVLDTFVPDQRGGTARSFDWAQLKHYAERDQVILAGGLNPDNAAAADALGVWALDVNSGVESEPGVKDPSRLNAFMSTLRGVGRRGDPP